MDSTTHIVMGIGLSGLAALDPVIAHESTTAGAVCFGTIIGSVIPDIDTVLKIKDNATYIRHHRGGTHSLPATVLWPILITAILGLIFPQANLLHLWLWTFLAVFLHVFVDIFNAYGTQALRPITNRWIALGIINIFDPIIFGVHIPGFLIWYFWGYSGTTFLTIYLILIGYYLIRIFNHHQAVSRVKDRIPDVQAVFLSPTIKWHQYHMAAKTHSKLIVGEIKGKNVNIIDTFHREPLPMIPEFQAAQQDKNIMAFLSFSPIYRWVIKEVNGFTEIRFVDLRYLTKGHYPFVAIAWVDPELNIRSSYTGWVYSEKKIRKKLLLAIK